MTEKEFEKLVGKALDQLPKEVLERMENVAITLEKSPSSEQLRKSGIRAGGLLLGLYQGIPKTKWGRGFGNILPDKITLFQEPIERLAGNEDRIFEVLKNTIFHEIAHHFGFSEKEIRTLERKRRQRS